MNKDQINKIKTIFASHPAVKLAYFFGSRARGADGPLSDYDLAVFLEEKNKKKMFEIQSALMDKIGRLLKTDKIDVVVLNTTKSPDIKFNIIKEGKLIYEKEPYRVIVEPRIMNEYFDFNLLLKKYNLTKV